MTTCLLCFETIPYHFHTRKMPFSKERVKRLEYGWGEISDIAVLDLNLKDQIVPENFLDEPQNNSKIQNLERIITRLKCIKLKHSTKVQLKRLENWHPNIPKKRLVQKPKTNNADGKDNSNMEVADISSDNGELVDFANHENENSTNNSDDDGNKSDDEYSMSNNELVGEHDENVDNSRDSEGGYDSVDDLFDSQEESDSHFTPGSSPRWDHDPFGLDRSKSSSRSSSWSIIMIEEYPVNSKPSTPTG